MRVPNEQKRQDVMTMFAYIDFMMKKYDLPPPSLVMNPEWDAFIHTIDMPDVLLSDDTIMNIKMVFGTIHPARACIA